jgi:hypothetical protein
MGYTFVEATYHPSPTVRCSFFLFTSCHCTLPTVVRVFSSRTPHTNDDLIMNFATTYTVAFNNINNNKLDISKLITRSHCRFYLSRHFQGNYSRPHEQNFYLNLIGEKKTVFSNFLSFSSFECLIILKPQPLPRITKTGINRENMASRYLQFDGRVVTCSSVEMSH